MKGSLEVAWSGDLSYGYLSELLSTVRSNFETVLLKDAPHVVGDGSGRRKAFIRHDIDVAPRFALPVARMEAELGVCASYQVMVDSSLYRIDEASSRRVMSELLALGHEVGLHVHVQDSMLAGGPYSDAVLHRVRSASNCLESIIGCPVTSMSFHRPQSQLLRGPLMIDGKVNGYAEPLMDWYLSDSAGRWREGNPIPTLLGSSKPLLQLLIHPIWWGQTHMSGPDRLQALFEEETGGKSVEFAIDFDGRLSDAIGVLRSGHDQPHGEENV